MISSIIAASLLFSAPGYSSTPKGFSNERTISQSPREAFSPGLIGQDIEPKSTAEMVPSHTFAIEMPDNLFVILEEKEIKEKTRQVYISAGATTALSALTLYYAFTTDPSGWLSGTAGSFCTNTCLTALATHFLRRDRNSLLKKQAASKK